MNLDPKLKHVHSALKQKFQGKKLIFGRGLIGSKIVFVCEVPGLEEDRDDKPIAGQSEKYLNKILKTVGIDKRKIYLTNVVKYFPSNHSLSPKEIKANIPFLKEELKTVGPNIVVTLGNTPLNGIGMRQPLDNIHGRVFNCGSYELLPTFHPDAALKNPQIKILLEADLVKLKELIKTK